MTVPIFIRQTDGQYEARLMGEPGFCAIAATRTNAISSLRTQLLAKETAGELSWLTIKPMPLSDLAGIWADREDLDEMVAEIYRQRDAERPV